MKLIVNSQSGFTMVEMMIATGLMAVAALGFSELMMNQLVQTRTTEVRGNYDTVVSDTHQATSQTGAITSSEVAFED